LGHHRRREFPGTSGGVVRNSRLYFHDYRTLNRRAVLRWWHNAAHDSQPPPGESRTSGQCLFGPTWRLFPGRGLAPAIAVDSWPTWEYRVEATPGHSESCAGEERPWHLLYSGGVAEKSPQLVKRLRRVATRSACHGFIASGSSITSTQALSAKRTPAVEALPGNTDRQGRTSYRAASFDSRANSLLGARRSSLTPASNTNSSVFRSVTIATDSWASPEPARSLRRRRHARGISDVGGQILRRARCRVRWRLFPDTAVLGDPAPVLKQHQLRGRRPFTFICTPGKWTRQPRWR